MAFPEDERKESEDLPFDTMDMEEIFVHGQNENYKLSIMRRRGAIRANDLISNADNNVIRTRTANETIKSIQG